MNHHPRNQASAHGGDTSDRGVSGVERVAEPDRWAWDRTLRVTTTEDDGVRLDVPGALRAKFIAYRERHGIRRAPPKAPNHGTA